MSIQRRMLEREIEDANKGMSERKWFHGKMTAYLGRMETYVKTVEKRLGPVEERNEAGATGGKA